MWDKRIPSEDQNTSRNEAVPSFGQNFSGPRMELPLLAYQTRFCSDWIASHAASLRLSQTEVFCLQTDVSLVNSDSLNLGTQSFLLFFGFFDNCLPLILVCYIASLTELAICIDFSIQSRIFCTSLLQRVLHSFVNVDCVHVLWNVMIHWLHSIFWWSRQK